ncbi:hypothetical protein F0U44_17685 [Nocardioides humilatus]|uniref:Uncharacterized protein n=1 Tax=Nocardioides humilatus TaxID=2607660 RepID=A0A5B1L8F8_9ACTN|nr:hypothetical protein [Nocardioides humilatus]KAA1417011.1 hypothetical protein F0U44_17685 [Nocardioides humilatus]
MTSQITTTHRPDVARATESWPLYAAVSVGLSVVLTAIGTFWSPLANYEATQSGEDFIAYLVVIAVIAVAAAVVFGLVVRKAPAGGGRVRTAVLSVLSVLSIAVFWAGLPMVFAGGAACLAMENPRSLGSRIVLVVTALVGAVAVWAALAG